MFTNPTSLRPKEVHRGERAKWVLNSRRTPISVGSQSEEGTAKSTHKVSAFSREQDAFLEQSTETAWLSFECLAASFLQLADMRLSDTQKLLLVSSAEVLQYHCITMTSLADVLARRTGVPYSTVKWNLRQLADLGLMEGGSSGDRGKPASLAPAARMLASHLKR